MKHTPLFATATTVFLSFLLCLANVLLIFHEQELLNGLSNKKNSWVREDDPLLKRLPVDFEDVSMVIQENHIFSLIDDRRWAQYIPGRRGFVRLGPKGRSFALSAYHQLHCINALRFSYTVARDGLITDPEVLKGKIKHDNHCFQFIRQSILCKADDTLIPVGRENQTLSGSGFGVMHRCRNWAQLRNWVLENDAVWNEIPFLDEGNAESEK